MATYILTKENENYIRLLMLISKKGTEVFRETTFQFTTRKCGVSTFKEVLDIAEPFKKKVTPNFVTSVLWPASDPPEFVNQLDITACNALLSLKHISDFNKSKFSLLKGLLKKIKDFRNQLCHNNAQKISDADFTIQFNDVKQVFSDIGSVHPSLHIPGSDIEHFRTLPITQDSYSSVLTATRDVLKEAIAMKQDIALHEQDIDVLKNVTSLQKHDLDVLKQNYDLLFRTVQSFQEKEKIPEEFLPNLKEALKIKYKDEMSYIQFNPVDSRARTPMDKLYVKLSLVEWDKGKTKGVPETSETLGNYSDIFKGKNANPFIESNVALTPSQLFEEGTSFIHKRNHRVVIIGKAGIGKTTISNKIAYDWALEREEALKQFEVVFVLSLRKVEKNQTLVECISDQLLSYKDTYFSKYLELFINENIDKCLFVFDGFDEMQQGTSKEIDKMIDSSYLSNCILVITSRPSQAYDIFRSKKRVDLYAEIEGFDREGVKEFIQKFFLELERADEGVHFFELILEKELLDIVAIPIVLDILCMLFAEEQHLPDTTSDIYKELREFLCSRQRHENTEGVTDTEELENLMLKLGKIAFEGLINDQLHFPAKNVDKQTLEIGLVAVDKDPKRMRKNTKFYFLHKSLQENLGAYYLARETKNGNMAPWEILKDEMKTAKQVLSYDLLLQFSAGESPKLGEMILDFLEQNRNMYDPLLRNALQAIDKISVDENLCQDELYALSTYAFEKAQLSYMHRLYGDYDTIQISKFGVLKNLKIPEDGKRQIVTQFFYGDNTTPLFEYDSEHTKVERCIAVVGHDRGIEKLILNTDSIALLYLRNDGFWNMEISSRSVDLLEIVLDRNTHMVSVLTDCIHGDFEDILELVRLVKNHPKVKYSNFSFEYSPVYSFQRYNSEWFGQLFQELTDIRGFIGFCLDGRDFPHEVLETMGKILSQNADTVLTLDFSCNAHFRSLTVSEGSLESIEGSLGSGEESLTMDEESVAPSGNCLTSYNNSKDFEKVGISINEKSVALPSSCLASENNTKDFENVGIEEGSVASPSYLLASGKTNRDLENSGINERSVALPSGCLASENDRKDFGIEEGSVAPPSGSSASENNNRDLGNFGIEEGSVAPPSGSSASENNNRDLENFVIEEGSVALSDGSLSSDNDNKDFGIKCHLHMLSNNITQQLSVRVLKLSDSLDAIDTPALGILLTKCPQIEILDISGNLCEVSNEILDLRYLKELKISRTVGRKDGGGLDVGNILANLGKCEELKEFRADQCEIDDFQLQKLRFNEATKLKHIDIDDNRIGSKGLQHICEIASSIQDLEELYLRGNKVGEQGEQLLVEHIGQFKNLKELGMNFTIENIEEKIEQHNIRVSY